MEPMRKMTVMEGLLCDVLDFGTMFDLHVPLVDIVVAPPLEELEPKVCGICGDAVQVDRLFYPIHPCDSIFCSEVKTRLS
jgi:hypothetical protein